MRVPINSAISSMMAKKMPTPTRMYVTPSMKLPNAAKRLLYKAEGRVLTLTTALCPSDCPFFQSTTGRNAPNKISRSNVPEEGGRLPTVKVGCNSWSPDRYETPGLLGPETMPLFVAAVGEL